jgi:predicted metalloprotease with PDZ domain
VMRRNYFLAGVLLLAVFAGPANATIRYRVSVAHPEQHLFRVTMMVPATGPRLVVALPAWNALYQVRDFAYRAGEVRATAQSASGGKDEPLAVSKLDKDTWQIFGEIASAGQNSHSAAERTVQIEYVINWDDPGPFNSQLNSHHAFANLAEILMYVPERRAEESRVEFTDLPASWRSAMELPAADAPNAFTAASYDALVDAPAELGEFGQFAFDENGAHFRVLVDGNGWKEDKLTDALRRITGYETRLMGGPPFHQYTFFFHFGPFTQVGGGGMEHANCTAISAGSGDFAVDVAAHEFFHAWNVKRIRPKTLEPVDFTREQYTRALWFAEGVTSAYGSYTLLRSGLWSRAQFVADLAGQFAELDARPAHLWQSAEQSSLDAWLEKYDYYRRPEESVSYYNKGQILGVMLDLKVRDVTNNRKSLDDVLRALNTQFAKRGRFYNDSEDIRAVAAGVAGQSLDQFFARYVSGTDEIPYDDFLALAGWGLKAGTHSRANVGFRLERGAGAEPAVAELQENSSAAAAGLQQGDVLLELDGAPPPRSTERWAREHAPNELVKVRFRRGGDERDVSFHLGRSEERRYEIEELPHASEKQVRIREGLLAGKTD